ncbi:MAG: ParB/RepB/Spo0J family partition protein [Candidatus Omnitrophota bacterium]
MQRKTLGKGLGALIPQTEIQNTEKIVNLKITQIKPNRYQPRLDFDEERLKELAESIKAKGIVQPIIVRCLDSNSYEIVAGERRFRAVKSLGFSEIPAIIRNIDEQDSLEFSLIENLQRQDLNPIEEARAFLRLIDEFGFTHEKIANVVTKDRATVSNLLRLLNLPQKIQDAVSSGHLSMGHARALLSVDDESQRTILALKVIQKGLSVRDLENLVSKKSAKKRIRHTQREPEITELEEELQRALGTKVKISHRKNKGHIYIEYYSLDGLEKLVSKLTAGK